VTKSEGHTRRQALIRIRKRLRLRQADVAMAAGISQPWLSLWETGYGELPEEVLDKIADFLLAEVNELRDPELAATLSRSPIPRRLRNDR